MLQLHLRNKVEFFLQKIKETYGIFKFKALHTLKIDATHLKVFDYIFSQLLLN